MKKSIIKNISLGITCLLGAGGSIVAASAFSVDKPSEEVRADDNIEFIYRMWNETNKEVVSIHSNCLTYTTVDSGTTTWTNGWYVLKSNVTFEDFDVPITIDGDDVNLILMDGHTLTVNSSIVVSSGNTLNIYSQSGGTGALNVTVGEEMGPGGDGAGIGGDEHNDCGTINIYGGNITANNSHGAAIGGGFFGNGGNITIYGGTINATSQSGAGIGGGPEGEGGTITIYGGNVTAVSTEDGAGIGGGNHASGGNITIHDGVVTAKGNSGAAIGGGSEGAGGTITINGGTVTATNLLNAAGIGGGQVASGGTINITGGTVYATGGAGAAGIGGGDFGNYGGTGGNVTISGGTVYATGGSESVGIGAGKNSTEHGSLTINEKNLGVYGGNSQDPTTRINKVDDDYARYRYMVVKDARHVHDDITFSPWESNDSLPDTAGSYYLTTDVTLTNKSWNVPGDVNLCLNDHIITITSSDWQHCIDLRYSTNPKTLNLYDEPHTTRYWINDSTSDYRFHGKIVSQSEYNSYTGYKGTFVGGAITSSIIDNSQRTLYVESSNIFNMYGGNIVGAYGHAIEPVSTSNITINGGKITGSSIAIYSDTSGNVTINGGEISGNQNGIRSTNPTGPINLNGGKISETDSVPYSSEAVSGCVINYNGTELLNNKCDFRVNSNFGYLKLEKPLPENSTYKIMCAQDGVFTKNWSTYMGEADPADYFVCYYENKVVERDGDEAAYRTTYTITYDGNGATSGTVPDPEAYISGKTATIAGNIGNLEKPGLFFAGWNTKADGTGNAYNAGSSMTVTANTTLYAQFVSHVHHFSYDASGNVITATCDNVDGNCPLPNHQATLTITGPSGSSVYDGTEKPATYVDTSSGAAFSNIKITYFKQGDTSFSGVPTDAGAYTALISFNESSLRASIQYDILKANVTYTAPTAKENLSYSGSAQDLVVAGSATGGTMQYKLGDNGVWSEEIPTATNAGTYYVYYKVVGDDNHNDVDVTDPIVLTIAKSTPTQVDPTAKTDLVYTGSAQDLINAGSSIDGTMKYKLGDDGVYSEDIPSAINAGNYTVYYKVFGDPNHGDSAEHSLVVNIAKADYETSVSLAGWSYGDTPNSPSVSNNPESGAVTYEYKEKAAAEETYSTTVPTNAGEYTVRATIAATTNYKQEVATTDFTISKVDASLTPPDIREELVYDGNPTYLTTKGSTNDGTIMYNIDGGEWQTERPEATNAGTYIVGYKVIGDANHNDTEPQYVPVTIAKADYETSVSLAGWSYGDTPNSPSVSNNPESGAVTYEYKEKAAAEETYSTTVPTNAGEYTVKATIAATTNYKQEVATADFTISKVAPTQVDPTAKTDLVYTGSAQDLINAGSSTDGTMKYKLGDDGVYSEDIPSAINAGNYTVYYKVFGDPNHEDSTEQSLVVTIGKAQAVVTAPTGISGLNYTGEDQVLINPGSSTFGEVLYKVNDGEYSTSLPIGKNVGNYTVYYKVESTDNYDGVAEASITVSITENNKDAIVNAINNADSYHDNIKDKYDIFANDVQDAINKANEVLNNPNVTEAEIAKAIEELNNAISEAQNDVAKVEETIETINKIGDVKYDPECEDAINAAREIYDSLTDEQKNQLGENYINKLTNAETKYASVKKTADILFIILLIVSSLALIGGICFLIVLAKKRKNDDDDENDKNGGSKKEPVKAMSIGGFLPFVILTSNYLKMPWIIVYIIAGLAILVWISVLIVALVKKNKKQAVSQKSNQIQSEVKPIETEQVESSKNEDEEVETIRDEKGNIFQIRFIKSFTAKLIQSPEETKKYYEELKNEVLSYKKTNSRVSWHYDAINSGREYVLKFAIRGKTLCVYLPLNVDDYVDSKYKVEKAESKRYEDVSCLYRIKNDRRLGYAKELIAVVANNLGLEKGEEQHEVYSNLPYEPNKPLVARGLIKEQKIQVNKPVIEPAILESKTNSDGDEVVVTKDASGNIFEIRYIKSFTAKLSQSEDIVKDYYTILKNYALSYKGSHSRVSWHYDAINVGRDYVLKFAVRGKTLCVYFALDASKLDEKYKVEEAKGKRFEDTPCLYRIKNDRKCEYAKELIDEVMKKVNASRGKEQNEDYRIAKESTKALLEKGLIKELKTKVVDKKVVEHYESISVSKADEVMSDDKAESSIEAVENTKVREGKKDIINIDTLSDNFNNGDEVTLEALIEKGLVSPKVGYIKVLARGVLDKKLTVVADDLSIQAVKMIVLTGGRARKIK